MTTRYRCPECNQGELLIWCEASIHVRDGNLDDRDVVYMDIDPVSQDMTCLACDWKGAFEDLRELETEE